MTSIEISYKELKVTFEKTHFKVINPVTYVQIVDEKIVMRSKHEMLTLYENLFYTKIETKSKKDGTEVSEKKHCMFVNDWMRDPCIRTYKEIVFEPCKEVSNDQYNQWNGWRASKLKKTDLKFENSLMFKHYQYLFGDEMFDYAMDYFAYIVQTGNKTDVSMSLQSKPGDGKDTGLNHFGIKILGPEYYLNEDHIDMLIGGNFNEDISHKCLIVLNESKRAKTDEIIEAIKNAITRDINSIRIKKEKTRHERNHINWVVLTNNFDSIKIEHNDRRFTARKIPSKKHSEEYFNNLHDEINSGIYDRAFYDYLLNRKIKVKSFQKERPITSYYNDLQERNIPITAQFLVNVMQEELDKTEELKASATDFYNRYCLFLKQNGFEYKTNITKFGLEMKQHEVVKKINTKKGRLYRCNIKELENYLISEKYYTLTDGVEEVNESIPKYIKSDDKAQYVRAEDYMKLQEKIKELQDELYRLREPEEVKLKKSKMVKVKKVTFEYDTDNDNEPIPETFKTNIFKQQKIEKEELNEIIDLLN